jgi:MEKHLA domain
MNGTPPAAALNDTRLALIVGSYRRLTGEALLGSTPDDPQELARALWFAPRAVVAHGMEADPLFFYGNCMALQLFEMNFEEFVQLPSRLSAEAPAQQERKKLLEQVARQGFVTGYSGMRIAGSGKRFMIADGVVWNLVDRAGIRHGQAATFIAQ